MKKISKYGDSKVLFRNGFIVDGTGKKGFWGDVLVQGRGVVSVTGTKVLTCPGAVIIDLQKKYVVAPGFIDMHGHSEMVPFKMPFMDSKLLQGITTEVVGNCGLSPAPCSRKNAEHMEDVYHFKGLKTWKHFHEYLFHLKNLRHALNIIPLVGQGTLHSYFSGYKKKSADKVLLDRMRIKLRQSLACGAFGLSLGLIYPPGCFTEKRELKALFQEVKKSGRFITVHLRDEGDAVQESVSEMISYARNTRVHVHLSHLKVNGKRNWSKCGAICRLVRTARKEGLNITADCYPYTASWTDLDTVLPDRVYEKGHQHEISLLQNNITRSKIRREFYNDSSHNDKDYFRSILIAQVRSVKNKIYEGQTLFEIAESTGKHPFDALCDLLVEEKLMVTAVFFGMKEKNMERILCEPYTVVGTDSSAKTFDAKAGKPHPRAFGTFPRFFEHFVKSGKMSLEKGVRKCTGLTADILGLNKKGYLKPGYDADITVFDLQSLSDLATYHDPVAKPAGIEYVMINGRFSCFQGMMLKERNGYVVLKI